MKLIVVVPVYNEEKTVVGVLDSILAQRDTVSHIVVVNDGSHDNSGGLIKEWAQDKSHVTVLEHATNKGYSGALLTGFNNVIERSHAGEFSWDDVIATVDADGQHD